MRLWERNGSGSARRAHRLVEAYRGERQLAPAIQAAIEAAVADKLAWGVLPALDDHLRATVDLYAVADMPEVEIRPVAAQAWRGAPLAA